MPPPRVHLVARGRRPAYLLNARSPRPFSRNQELTRYLLQLKRLQSETNSLAIVTIAGERVCPSRLIEDQGQVTVHERYLRATGKARLILERGLFTLMVHTDGVPPPW